MELKLVPPVLTLPLLDKFRQVLDVLGVFWVFWPICNSKLDTFLNVFIQ